MACMVTCPGPPITTFHLKKTFIFILVFSRHCPSHPMVNKFHCLQHQNPKMTLFIWIVSLVLPLTINAHISVYTVTAQGRLISDSSYDITVALVNGTQPLRFIAALNPSSGLPSDGGALALGSLDLQPGNTTTLTLRIPKLINSAFYHMHFDGFGAVNFSHSLQLLATEPSVLLHIFTDKDKFNPGETVHFNIIALADEVRVREVSGLNVTIQDPSGKDITSWPDITTNRGTFSAQFEIPELKPEYGAYKLIAQIPGHKMVKTFHVTDHEFPLFHVHLQTPDFVDVDTEDSITISVKACYLSGLPVTGKLSLTASQYLSCILDNDQKDCQFLYKNDSLQLLDGEATIPIQLKDMKNRPNLHLHAIINDSLAGRSHEAYEHITLTHNPLRVVILQTRDRFKPGIPFELQVNIGYLDGTTPSHNVTESLAITGTFLLASQEALTSTQNVPIPDDGHVAITLIPPAGAVYLKFNASYAGITASKKFAAESTAGGNYIGIQYNGPYPKVGEVVNVAVLATSKIDQLFFQIVSGSNGSILESGSVAGNDTSAIVPIDIAEAMVPIFELLVFYITPEGEIVIDSKSIATDNFAGNLNVSVKPQIVSPGGVVTVGIHSESADTLVFLSGIDNGARFLGLASHPGYRLERSDKALKEGKGKGSKVETPKKPTKGPGSGRSIGNIGSPEDTINDQLFVPHHFKQAGVFFFTNGLVRPILFDKFPVGAEEPLTGRQPSLASDSAENKPMRHKDRENFPITWFWTNVTTGDDGSTNFIVKAPDSITTWDISAMGVSPSYALGVPSKYPKVEVFKEFYIQLLVPYSVQRGEAAEIKILVFNPTNESVEANVTIFNDAGRFQLLSTDSNAPLSIQSNATEAVDVPAGGGSSVCFLISPLYLGQLDIRVTAEDGTITDTVIEKILVQMPQPGPLFQGEDGVVKTAEDIEGRNDILSNISQPFNVTAMVHILGSGSAFRLELCLKSLTNDSQGVLIEVWLPSGYKVRPDPASNNSVAADSPRRETKRKRTVAVIYFRKIPKQVCVTIRAVRWQKVINLKPAQVRVFDAEAGPEFEKDEILAKLMYTVQPYERKK